ncbi:MAG: hypothetical protein JST85_10535 [Acidobacteria bacterium]|nr:hypothetical protein [Acidobacteriota bacterium]
MTNEELIERFENLTLQPELFHHREHVRLAWVYLDKYPTLTALSRFCEGLKRFAASVGKPDRYHETITWAYLLLIRERMANPKEAKSWETFAEANGDLLTWDPNILKKYYREETLQSDLAKRVFLFPDK